MQKITDETTARFVISAAEREGSVRIEDAAEALEWLRERDLLAPNGLPWGDVPFDGRTEPLAITLAPDEWKCVMAALTADARPLPLSPFRNALIAKIAVQASAGASSPLPAPPEHLHNAWERYQSGGAGAVSASELRKLDEWRDDCARDAGL